MHSLLHDSVKEHTLVTPLVVFVLPLFLGPLEKRCSRINNMSYHPKGAPALECKGGRRAAETSAAPALLPIQLVAGGGNVLGSHCSRATPSTKS